MAAVSSEIEPLPPSDPRRLRADTAAGAPVSYWRTAPARAKIMAGLYLKEMMSAPTASALWSWRPGTADQWHDRAPHGSSPVLRDADSVDDGRRTGQCLRRAPALTVCIDSGVSRSDALMDQLRAVRWDVAVVDEAHRMSSLHLVERRGEDHETRRWAGCCPTRRST